MNSLNRLASRLICHSSTLTAEPTFSTTPDGCQSIWIITRVEVSLRRWKVTTPGMLGIATDAAPGNPFVRVLLGDLGVELPLHARNIGHPVVACVIELGDRLDAGHELRNDSNCVHWL
jgi:hypothetical protein